jgi:hypothetical protein
MIFYNSEEKTVIKLQGALARIRNFLGLSVKLAENVKNPFK